MALLPERTEKNKVKGRFFTTQPLTPILLMLMLDAPEQMVHVLANITETLRPCNLLTNRRFKMADLGFYIRGQWFAKALHRFANFVSAGDYPSMRPSAQQCLLGLFI